MKKEFVKQNFCFLGNNISEVNRTLKIWKKLFLFCFGGGLYAVIELLWRGRTHGSMFLLGGGCFLALGALRRSKLPTAVLPLAGAAIITAGELATGLLVNRNFAVWDYRSVPGNFLGQICPLYTLLWMPLSMAAMVVDQWLNRRLSGLVSTAKY